VRPHLCRRCAASPSASRESLTGWPAREAPLTGLFRFDLQPYAYDTTLAGLAPYEDVWVSLTIARRVANELGLADDLAGLLDWDSRFAWTIADKEEAALRHKCAHRSEHATRYEAAAAGGYRRIACQRSATPPVQC
jgi:hypothetical protein